MKLIIRFINVSTLLTLVCSSLNAQDTVNDVPQFKIARITILVKDYDEALKFYTEALGFVKKADMKFGSSERWITVSPAGQKEVEFVLVQPSLKEDIEMIGKQAGTRTFIVINTTDCEEVIEHYKKSNVRILAEPHQVPWGTQAQFADLYGNHFVLLEAKTRN